MNRRAKQFITICIVLVAIGSVGIAGVGFAQTQNVTTSSTVASTTPSTTTAIPSTSLCNCEGGAALGWRHAQAAASQNASSRQGLAAWYQQLPQDQKTALHNDLQQAFNTWYQQLPQDQKDKLTTILDQLPQNQTSTIENKLGIQ